jgi:hypothetical protein
MSYLSNKVMREGRGDRYGVLCNDASGTTLLAFCWIDRDRRYFIATCSSLADGPPCVRQRMRQVDKTRVALPERQTVVVRQPVACSVYYGACSTIDRHNKCRQAYLQLEKKHKTTVWNRRVNMSIFGMCVVDAYMLMLGCRTQVHNGFQTSKHFFAKLAEELIDNTYELRAHRKRVARAAADLLGPDKKRPPALVESTKQLVFPTPTKRKKKNNTLHHAQGRCLVCRNPTTHVCRECQGNQPNPREKQYWICNKPGKECMGAHILSQHPFAIKQDNQKNPTVSGEDEYGII